jgi:hypothetical protein
VSGERNGRFSEVLSSEFVATGALSAIADIEAAWVLRRQCGGLLTVEASSTRTAASCISEFTLSTLTTVRTFTIATTASKVQRPLLRQRCQHGDHLVGFGATRHVVHIDCAKPTTPAASITYVAETGSSYESSPLRSAMSFLKTFFENACNSSAGHLAYGAGELRTAPF